MSKVVTKNSCSYCSPLGASLAFKGIENCITMLHGSQGCATYMRRFLISHFREPMDIASSSFTEETAIFGGGENLKRGLDNIVSQYEPKVIGLASTCLSETIGDDMSFYVREYYKKHKDTITPVIIDVSTPSYKESHSEGFHGAVRSIVDKLASGESENDGPVTIFPGMISCEDLRYLKDVFHRFEEKFVMVPDYSETLEGGVWREYQKIPPGGTTVEELEGMGSSRWAIEFASVISDKQSPAKLLNEKCGVDFKRINIPVGLSNSDLFFQNLCKMTDSSMPDYYKKERGRLIDAMGDSHKYLFGKRVIIYGDEDFTISLASFLLEIGLKIEICGSEAKSGKFKILMTELALKHQCTEMNILEGADFGDIEDAAVLTGADLIIGSSKGFKLSKKIDAPLIRVGFPIHDRVGAQRVLHIGYAGALNLLDLITNTIIEQRQSKSSIGYTYM